MTSGFSVLTAVKMALAFLVVTLCELVDIYRHFGRVYCLHIQWPRTPISTSGHDPRISVCSYMLWSLCK